MDRREHHRAHLRLPVRLRWNTPFGYKTEVTRTLDVSRGGLRVPCDSSHAPGVSVWVTFPYDDSLGEGQPEILARVERATPSPTMVRSGAPNAGENGTAVNGKAIIGLSLQAKLHANGNGRGKPPQRERRSSRRHTVAFRIRVRQHGIPWFEEAMTTDVSVAGVRFVTNREYQAGDVLLVSSASEVSPPGLGESEIPFRVKRLEAIPQSAAVAVALSRLEVPLNEAHVRARASA